MATHSGTLPRGEWRIPRAEETALFARTHPDLRLLSWVVLQDWANDLDMSALRAAEIATQEEVERAATYVFRITQTYLRRREGCTLPRRVARSVWDPANTARLAVEAISSRTRAKELQLGVAGGRPLTVCLGHTIRRLPELRQQVPGFIEHFERKEQEHPDGKPSTADVVSSGGDGCMQIVPDSTRLRPPAFSRYCQDCGNRSSEIRRKRLREIKMHWSGVGVDGEFVPERSILIRRTADGPVYRRTCSACRRLFETMSSREKRCRSCIGGHKGPPAP